LLPFSLEGLADIFDLSLRHLPDFSESVLEGFDLPLIIALGGVPIFLTFLKQSSVFNI
jgi:hypothetical protein